MRSLIKLTKFIFICALLCIFLISCSSLPSSEEDFPYRVTAIIPHNDTYYWTLIGNAMVEAGKESGADVKVQVPQLNYNIPQMTTLIRQAAASQADAIIVQGIQDEDYLAALEKAYNNGILIVFVDTDIENFPQHLYVGTDNLSAGRLVGEQIVSLTNARGNVAIISAQENYTNLNQRISGIEEVLKEYPQLSLELIAYDNFDPQQVLSIYDSIIREYPQIDTLVCVEGTGGQSLGRVLTQKNDSIPNILVFDRSDETLAGVQNGIFDCLIQQDTQSMGQLAVEYLVQYLKTGKLEQWQYYTNTTIFTQEALKQEVNSTP